jgi:hypothetical protein
MAKINTPSCQHCGNNDPWKFIYEDRFCYGSAKSGHYMEKDDLYKEKHMIKCRKCRRVVAVEVEGAYRLKWERTKKAEVSHG